MRLPDITVTAVGKAFSVLSEKGRLEKMTGRACYGLSLCRSGQITYIQGGCEYVSRPGAAVLLPKGGSYTIRGDQTGVFPVINFDCLEDLGALVRVIPLQQEKQLLSDYEKLRQLSCFEGSRMQIFSLFYGMLDRMREEDIPYAIRAAVELIRSDCGAPEMTNRRLAQACGMSEVYFRKLFTQTMHVSPRQYVIALRIQKARQMLAEGAMTMADISEVCGFSNPYHFSRAFRQHTGMSPSDYRASHRLVRL